MKRKHAKPPIIRPARQQDVSFVIELIAPFVAKKKLLPRQPEDILKLIPHGFVAEDDDRPVGFAALEIYSPKLAEIQCLAVEREYQGRGIAKQLILSCIERARERDVYELMAITSSEKPFRDSGFDYSLPYQKRALFIHPGEI